MLTTKTVLVVGAGASKDAGLPIGSELAKQISGLLYFEIERYGGLKRGDYELFETLRANFRDNDLLKQILEGEPTDH